MMKYVSLAILATVLLFSACSDDGGAFDPAAAVVGFPDDADVQVSIPSVGDSVVIAGRVGLGSGVTVIFTNDGSDNRLIVSRNGVAGDDITLDDPASGWYRIPMLEMHNEDGENETLVLVKVTSPDMLTIHTDWSTEGTGVVFAAGTSPGTDWPQPLQYGGAQLKVDGVDGGAVVWVNHAHEH